MLELHIGIDSRVVGDHTITGVKHNRWFSVY
jgi:hypothetical protein